MLNFLHFSASQRFVKNCLVHALKESWHWTGCSFQFVSGKKLTCEQRYHRNKCYSVHCITSSSLHDNIPLQGQITSIFLQLGKRNKNVKQFLSFMQENNLERNLISQEVRLSLKHITITSWSFLRFFGELDLKVRNE